MGDGTKRGERRDQALKGPSEKTFLASRWSVFKFQAIVWSSQRPGAPLGLHASRGGVARSGSQEDGSVYVCPTCTLDSGKLIFSATSSRMKMSGYRVLANSASSTSSCARVKVVLSRRCFRGVAAGQEAQGPLGWGSSFSVKGVSVGAPTSPPPRRSTPRSSQPFNPEPSRFSPTRPRPGLLQGTLDPGYTLPVPGEPRSA